MGVITGDEQGSEMDRQIKTRLAYELNEYYKEGEDAIGECPLYIFQMQARDIELVEELLNKEMHAAIKRVIDQLPEHWKEITPGQIDGFIAGAREDWYSEHLATEFGIE